MLVHICINSCLSRLPSWFWSNISTCNTNSDVTAQNKLTQFRHAQCKIALKLTILAARTSSRCMMSLISTTTSSGDSTPLPSLSRRSNSDAMSSFLKYVPSAHYALLYTPIASIASERTPDRVWSSGDAVLHGFHFSVERSKLFDAQLPVPVCVKLFEQNNHLKNWPFSNSNSDQNTLMSRNRIKNGEKHLSVTLAALPSFTKNKRNIFLKN